MNIALPPVERRLSTGATPDPRPPGPPWTAAPVLLAKLIRDRLAVMTWASATYGDAVRLPLGPAQLYFFNHPDHAKHVLADNSAAYRKGIGLSHARRALGDGLLTSEGELWQKQRKTIQPAFQARRMAEQAEGVAEEAAHLVDRLARHAGRGPVDIREEMTGLTLGVLGRTLLGVDLSAETSIGHSFEAVQDQAIFEMMSLGMVPAWVPLPSQLRFRRARKDLAQIVRRLIADHAERPAGTGDDVLTRLVDSVRREPDPRVGEVRIRDELITLLLAGHETTASTLSWAFHLIDGHQEVGERLREEAVRVLGDRLPVYEDLRRLTYTVQVVEETMRLYPPVWILTRRARADDTVGGYPVPVGTDILICPYTLHRHPGYWDAPDRFRPDRFAPERAADRPRYAYIPFGAGPRFCVGNNLGMLEAVFVLALVSREFRLVGMPGRPVRAEPMLSLRVKGGLPMTVHRVS
jgi:cytochrome P450